MIEIVEGDFFGFVSADFAESAHRGVNDVDVFFLGEGGGDEGDCLSTAEG